MREIVSAAFVSLDGVMQAPGGPDEDRSGDAATKYVATHRPESLAWQNSRALGSDVVAGLRAVKREAGPPLVTQGSSALLQTLLAHDLVDEIRLFVFPLTLGTGKRFFGAGTQPRTFAVTASTQSSRGAQLVRYRRAGKVVTGSLDAEESSEQRQRLA